MGMNTHIIGFKAPDEKWKKMKAVYDACEVAGTAIPMAVTDYFNDEPPDDAGVEVELEEEDCVEKWREEMEDGFVVDVKRLLNDHPDITHIRFYNSY